MTQKTCRTRDYLYLVVLSRKKGVDSIFGVWNAYENQSSVERAHGLSLSLSPREAFGPSLKKKSEFLMICRNRKSANGWQSSALAKAGSKIIFWEKFQTSEFKEFNCNAFCFQTVATRGCTASSTTSAGAPSTSATWRRRKRRRRRCSATTTCLPAGTGSCLTEGDIPCMGVWISLRPCPVVYCKDYFYFVIKHHSYTYKKVCSSIYQFSFKQIYNKRIFTCSYSFSTFCITYFVPFNYLFAPWWSESRTLPFSDHPFQFYPNRKLFV